MSAEQKLKKTIQIRNGHRLHVKKTISLIHELTSTEEEKSIARLQACKAELVKQQQRIEALDAEIEDLIIDDSSIEQEILNKSEVSALIQETVCFVNSFLSKSSASASPENITSAASATVQQKAACSSTKVKYRNSPCHLSLVMRHSGYPFGTVPNLRYTTTTTSTTSANFSI